MKVPLQGAAMVLHAKVSILVTVKCKKYLLYLYFLFLNYGLFQTPGDSTLASILDSFQSESTGELA